MSLIEEIAYYQMTTMKYSFDLGVRDGVRHFEALVKLN